MATVNTLKTRILNKYDLLANYSNFTPLKGEICIAVIGEETTTNKGFKGDITKTPIVGMKVGDGSTTFNNLPWIQAIAGDVSTFVKGIVDEAKFNELVNALIANAKLASAADLAGVDERLKTAEGEIDALQEVVLTGDDSNAKLRTAINAVLGTAADTSASNTVYGAKKYAEEKAAAAQTAAQGYADGKFEEKGVAADLVDGLKANEIKANADAISGINTKIGEVAYTGDSLTAAIAGLQQAVGADAEGLGGKVADLEELVGDAEGGLVKDVADLKQADIDMDSRVDTLEGEMDAVEGKLTGITGTVAEAIGAVDDKAEQNKTDIATEKGRVDALVGTNAGDAGKSVRDIAALVISEALAGGGEDFDTLQEIAAWLKDHPEDVGEINAAIQSVKTNLGYTTDEGGNEVVPATVDQRIANAISALEIGTYAKQADLEALDKRVKDIEDAPYATEAYADQAEADAISTVVGTSGDAKTANTVYGAKAFATDAAATAKSEAIADAAGKYEEKGVAEGLVNGLANGAVKTNADAIKAINDEIDAMDATFADTNAGVMTGITQADGKITAVTQRKVKAADMDESDVFVFYCGNATGYDASMGSVEI